MRTGLEAVAISVVLMLVLACRPLTSPESASSPRAEPDLSATTVPVVEATLAASLTPTPSLLPAQSPTVPGQYSWAQLNEWYQPLWNTVHKIPGVMTIGISETRNRILITFTPRRRTVALLEAELERLGIPREAVIIESGCKGNVYKHEFKTPSPGPNEELRQSVHPSLEVPSEVRFGETVPLKLRVKNTSNRPVQLYLGGRPPHDFVATTLEGAQIWYWRCGIIVQAILDSKILKPGEELEFTAAWEQVWEQVDNNGDPVPPGTYWVRGVLNMEDQKMLQTEAHSVTISAERN